MGITISCATNKELLNMRLSTKSTKYFISLVDKEIEKRDLTKLYKLEK